MADALRIAVVEGEADLRRVVCDYLRLHGFDAVACPDAAALDAALAGPEVAAVLLDLNLPRAGELSIARRLRALPNPPGIIVVTALAAPVDRVVRPEIGADDYIAKPFELRELLARLRSLLRRKALLTRAAGPALPAKAERIGPFTLLLGPRRLLDQEGREVRLTTMEFDLLAVLATHRGKVLSREALLDLAHGKRIEPFDRSIDIRVTRLRRKIEPDPANPTLIRTIRGQGYMLSPDEP